MMNANQREQVEPTRFRATPYSDGGKVRGDWNRDMRRLEIGKGKSKGKPAWRPVATLFKGGKGKFSSLESWQTGRAYRGGGDLRGRGKFAAPQAASPGRLGKGAAFLGGKGGSWVQGVRYVPYCSSSPGSSFGTGGRGNPRRTFLGGGDLRGWTNFSSPNAASPVVSGKGGSFLGGRGRGWDHRVPFVPVCSNLPGNHPKEMRPTNPPWVGVNHSAKTPTQGKGFPRMCWFGAQCKFKEKFCPFLHIWAPHLRKNSWKGEGKVQGKGLKDAVTWKGKGKGESKVQGKSSLGPHRPGVGGLDKDGLAGIRKRAREGEGRSQKQESKGRRSENFWSVLGKGKSKGRGRVEAPGQKEASHCAPEGGVAHARN